MGRCELSGSESGPEYLAADFRLDWKRGVNLPKRVRLPAGKCLNNAIEPDHRRLKQRLHPMLARKNLRIAAIVIDTFKVAVEARQVRLEHGAKSKPPWLRIWLDSKSCIKSAARAAQAQPCSQTPRTR